MSEYITQRLGVIEGWLGRAVGDAISLALAVPEPAGSTPEWAALVSAYGCRPSTDDERRQLVVVTGPTFGAPAGEVQRVLDAIAVLGITELKSLDHPDDNALARRYDRLARALDDLQRDALPHYRNRVVPRRSMFGASIAAARARAGEGGASPDVGNRQAFILRCTTCGGPRLDEALFECAFCGAHLGAGGS